VQVVCTRTGAGYESRRFKALNFVRLAFDDCCCSIRSSFGLCKLRYTAAERIVALFSVNGGTESADGGIQLRCPIAQLFRFI
jgi:hypothetical protein